MPSPQSHDHAAPAAGAAKAWGGVFREPTDKRVEAFSESVSFDRRLADDDIDGSIAHARMLAACGLMSVQEADAIAHVMEEIRGEIRAGRFEFTAAKEDIHLHIESALTARLGDTGRKLHTARSRNDQVATDLRLYCRRAIDRLDRGLAALQAAFLGLAEREQGLVIPGYTHMRRAQPVLAAHQLLAWCEKLGRDRERLADCRKRTNILPLGSGAIAGTSLPIDREHVKDALGFDAVAANSLDAASDRDFACELAFVLSLTAVHLSQWAEEWILYSTPEFGFVLLPEGFCTGSSIMPQKINPDVLELVRGKSARAIGNVQALLVLLKGLPTAYNRDLQEDKEPLFDSLDQVNRGLEAIADMVSAATFHVDAMQRAADAPAAVATDVAEWLVARGLPFRQAHAKVGELVSRSLSNGTPLVDLVRADSDLGPDAAALFAPGVAVQRRSSHGAAGPKAAVAQRDELHRVIAALQSRLP